MKYYYEYLELYHTDDDWYIEYIDKQLKQIKRRYKHDNKCRAKTKE